MKSILIKDIIVKERQRKKLVDIDKLADSIKKVGLIHPIVVDPHNTLLAGERRLSACKALGWEYIPVFLFGELTDIERKEIELEENIRRKDLEWQDEVRAKKELDELKRKIHGSAYQKQGDLGWGLKDTANSLGESLGNISMDIQVAKGLETFPDIANASNKTQAYNMLKRKIDNVIRTVVAGKTGDVVGDRVRLMFGDCIEKLKELDDNSIDVIITDPPFGVGLDKKEAFTRVYNEPYNFDDSKEHWDILIKNVTKELYRVLKEDGHMYIFFATIHQFLMEKNLRDSEWNFFPMPCIWAKGENAGQSYDPYKRFRPNYEPFYFCWKSNPRSFSKPHGSVFNFPVMAAVKKVHPAEKPKELAIRLCELSSLKGEVILDAFAGVGSLLQPCLEMERKVIGIEIDEKYFNIMRERLKREC